MEEYGVSVGAVPRFRRRLMTLAAARAVCWNFRKSLG